MRTIWKYELKTNDFQEVEMQKGAEILCVKTQHDIPCLWAIVRTEAKTEKREFRIVGTGHPYPEKNRYIDSYLIRNDSLVFHVFEI